MIPPAHVYNTSILDFEPAREWDLTLIKGVLIHINPDQLLAHMQRMFEFSRRFVLMGEYFNRTPVSLEYRGEKDRLFKLRFQLATGQLENSARLSQTKRDIARLTTELRAREIAAAEAAAGGEA